MNLREALSAALLFTIAFSPFAISQDVPEDVVYTEVKKTLVTGTKGVLTCKFKGAPNAVYWKRGSDPENSPSIITWGYGKKYGPRYDDGSCDIDENYSLVIKNVTSEDEGRYICRVSNYKAILIYNYTDVTVTNIAVKTDQSILVRKGEVGVLPCEVNIRPRTVSWLRGYNETLVTMDLSRYVIERGELGQFNITEDYSLVIYDVAVQHEDEYFCEIADYDTGSTYKDATLLNVFAYPREPFPSIKECPVTSSSSCTLHIKSDTTITCQVEGYYPHIDLYFMSGSDRVETLEARKWNNSDGTLNKLIEIENDGSSETSFECVATGLMGQGDIGSMTIHLIPNNERFRVAVAVVVPVISVSALIVTGVLVYKQGKAHSKRKYERAPIVPMVHKQKQEDLISYIEIWMLVKYAVQPKVSKNHADVPNHLPGDKAGSRTLQKQEEYYKKLCAWKEGYSVECQRKDILADWRKRGLGAALDKLHRYSNSTREVTSDDLEHTLWHVGGSGKIIELLNELGELPEEINKLQNKSSMDVIVGAMNILKYWRDVNNTGNQEVMLSLALEKINYSPNDEDFFRIPGRQKCGLDKQEIQSFLSPKVTSRHCTVLCNAIVELKENASLLKNPIAVFKGTKKKDAWLNDVIEKNRTDLFDSHQMIEDWWAEQNCSNYEKRRRLLKAADVSQGRGTHIVTERREDHENSPHKKTDGAVNYGPISHPKGEFIYKAELVDMALDLVMEDFRPLANALKIEGRRLTSYKREFHPSHLERGSIGLVLQLAKVTGRFRLTAVRPIVCDILNKAGYRKVTSRFMFASEPSYGELFAVKAALTQGDMKTKTSDGNVRESPRSEATLPSVDVEETQTNYVSGTEGCCEKSVEGLKSILGLTNEDIPESSTNHVLMMFKIWKERVCPGLIDHRVVLAEGIKKTGKPHLVRAMINGEYHSNKTSIEFIENMLKGLDEDRRTTLEGLLKEADKGKWPKNSSGMPQDICNWISQWTKEMSKKHRDFNDKLVNHGFLDLAREIMNIEQYR